MGFVANQRTVRVVKEDIEKQQEVAMINLKALEEASLNLNGVAFKLWVYFSKNKNHNEIDMWTRNLNKFGISKGGSYDRAWRELEEKGYLKAGIEKNKYIFYEIV